LIDRFPFSVILSAAKDLARKRASVGSNSIAAMPILASPAWFHQRNHTPF
jgi:hypothetical protein